MAYDNYNAYPKKNPGVERESAAGSAPKRIGMGDSLESRTIDAIRDTLTDMSRLKSDRADYQRAYMAERDDTNKSGTTTATRKATGRSRVVDSSVQDTIESVMPDMMNIFYGGKDVLEVTPRETPEDEIKAKFMTEKANFDIQKQNEGFKLIYQFVKDALMFKQGVIKYYWEKKTVTESFASEGLTYQELTDVLADDDFIVKRENIKLIDQDGKEKDDVTFDELDANGFGLYYRYDISGKKVLERVSRPVLQNLPSEEFGFDVKAKSIKSAFCYHKKKVHWKKLKKYGLTREDINEMAGKFDNEDEEINPEVQARFEDLGGPSFVRPDDDLQHVYIYECYINDYNEDGDPINKQVLIFGDKMLNEEENSYKTPPFCVISPILVTHRMCGRSLAELCTEIQKLKTALIRYTLDNIYFQNNGLRVINPYRIDLDAFLNQNKPGGVVRTLHDINPSDAIYNIPVAQLSPIVMKMIEYTDGPMKERRTGVTAYSQGLDSKSLNKTATGISIITSHAQKRIELMARIMAETGIKDLYESVVQMNIDYFDIEQNIKLGKKWETITPENINAKFDVNIEVGSFSSNSEMEFQQLNMMLDKYQQLGGGIAQLYGPESVNELYNLDNIKNILKKMWENLGYKNTDLYMAQDKIVPEGTQGGMDGAGGQIGLAPGGNGEGQMEGLGGEGVAQPPDIGGILQGLQGGGIQ